MSTALGKKLVGEKAAAAKSRLAAVLDRDDRGELVELHGLGLAWLRLIGSDEVTEIEAELFRRMKDLGLEANVLNGLTYEAERAKLTLARVVRDPDDHAKSFGTLDEWGQVDPDTIAAAWSSYADMRTRRSPLDVAITPELRAQIESAISKKNGMLLRSFDVLTLSSYLLSTEFPRASSPTPMSATGPSPSES